MGSSGRVSLVATREYRYRPCCCLSSAALQEGERVVVDFIGWGNREEYPLQQVVLLPQVSATDFPVGTAAQAIYSGDGYAFRRPRVAVALCAYLVCSFLALFMLRTLTSSSSWRMQRRRV